MALPPNMVVPGLDLDDTAGLPDVEIPIDVPMEFPDGAEIIEDGEGGAIVQAIREGEMEIPDEAIPFDANLAEFWTRARWESYLLSCGLRITRIWILVTSGKRRMLRVLICLV